MARVPYVCHGYENHPTDHHDERGPGKVNERFRYYRSPKDGWQIANKCK